MHGRIGDSAIIGAGIYADNTSGAACATGDGELFIRLCLSNCACEYMKFNNALVASRKAIEILNNKFGQNTGGVIAVDSKGKFGASINTDSMPTILLNSLSAIPKVALNKREIEGIF